MKTNASRLVRFARFALGTFALLLLAGGTFPLLAQPTTTDAGGSTGSVSGSVRLAAAGGPVNGATVRVVGTDLETRTDRAGNFELFEVPIGRHALAVTGSGIRPMQVTEIAIEPNQQLALSPIAAQPASAGSSELVVRSGAEVVTLSKMVVEGYRAGRARALQQKRDTPNILDVISADAIGNLPDRNAAEAVSRLPGVNLAPLDGPFDQPQGGEGRYVSIRGVDPNLNQVLIDGNTMSAPGGTRLGRAVPLDVLGSTQISQLEVIKSSTPDMDGNSLGGTINVKTGSAFDRGERFFQGSATFNYNEVSTDKSPSIDLSYGDIVGKNRQWGFTVSATTDKRNYGQERLDFTRPVENRVGSQVFLLPNQIQIRPTWGYRLNSGATLNLEYRPNDTTQLYLRSIVNRTKTEQNWDEMRLDSGGDTNTITLTTPTHGVFAAARTQAQYRESRQNRSQGLTNVATGFKKVLGTFSIDGSFSYSYAEEVRDMLRQLRFQTTRGALNRLEFDYRPGDRFPYTWVGVGPEWTDPAKYSINLVRKDDGGVIEDKTLGGRLDVQWKPAKLLGGSGFLKAGLKASRRDRFVDLIGDRWNRVGNWTLATIPNGTAPGRSIYDGRYRTGMALNWPVVWKYTEDNPALTVFDPVASESNSVEDDYKITEDIYAGYGMANIRFGQLTLLGGLRWERTEATIGAVEARTANGVNLGRFPIKGGTQYNSWFPNLQAIFRPGKTLVLRGALTQSIGRPAYEDMRPLSTFRYDEILGSAALNPAFPYSGSLSIGNPDLKPFKGTNYDTSVEWYLPGGSMLSAAYFRKDIKDPIYGFSEVQENVIHGGIGLERLSVSTRLNGDSGQIKGLELSLYLPFRFLRAPFDGLGVESNLTFVSSSVVVRTRPGEDLPFFRQPDRIRNATLFFEKRGFSARVSYSYTEGMMTSLGSAPSQDNWSDPLKRFDAQVSYRFSRHYALRLAARNLTREQENYSFGRGGPLRETYLIGRSYTVGLNVNY